MKNIIYGIFTVAFCFIVATKSDAQSVYGESWLEYDDTTNTVRAVAYSAPDYNVDVYYCVEVSMTVYEGEEYLGSQGGMNVNESGWPTGQSAAKIEGKVKDRLNGRPVKSASITLRRTDNPELLYRTSTDYTNPGKFKIVVPTDPFTITVEAPGYQPWVYGDDGPLARPSHSMILNRGEVRKLEVALRKAANQ